MAEKKVIRWGLLGAGVILDRWMNGVKQVDGMEIVAIASRTVESARRMAEKYNIPDVCASYEELVARDDIDIVYVPVPHPFHKRLAMMAMNAGKAVLCEKPAAVNGADFAEMAACAKKNNVFFMEAVWTRFFPLWEKVHEVIDSGEIGAVHMLKADLSSSTAIYPDCPTRLIDPNAAGGGLLDVGVYSLNFAGIITGKKPVKIMGMAAMDTDDKHITVDETNAYMLQYDDGVIAMLTGCIYTKMPENAAVYGSHGCIEIPDFYRPQIAKITHYLDGTVRTIESPVPQRVEGIVDEGYQFEVFHVNDCLRSGLKESPVVPHSATQEILNECDELRRQWGLKYPFEK